MRCYTDGGLGVLLNVPNNKALEITIEEKK